MKRFFTRQRVALSFSVTGIVLMGVDLMVTRDFFVHVGELMIASIVCLALGIFIDREKRGERAKDRS
jgi:ABC-type microcin C transport system permease subunit YejB